MGRSRDVRGPRSPKIILFLAGASVRGMVDRCLEIRSFFKSDWFEGLVGSDLDHGACQKKLAQVEQLRHGIDM